MTDAVQRLLDEEAVGRVVRTVARAIDRLDFELLASCYHPDATDERHGRVRGIAEFLEWVQPILHGMQSTLHALSTQLVDVDGDVAHAETYCTARHVAVRDDGETQVWFAYLRYVDRLQPPAGRRARPRAVCAQQARA